jgi:hypothetical protein
MMDSVCLQGNLDVPSAKAGKPEGSIEFEFAYRIDFTI